jgi:hypothetical protein
MIGDTSVSNEKSRISGQLLHDDERHADVLLHVPGISRFHFDQSDRMARI